MADGSIRFYDFEMRLVSWNEDVRYFKRIIYFPILLGSTWADCGTVICSWLNS